MENESASTPSPWFAVWTRPRATIRRIVDSPDPERLVLLLAALGGISRTLDRADSTNWGNVIPTFAIFGLATIVGAVLGVVLMYVSGWLLRWTGGWFGGRAPAAHVRAAIAWAEVPLIWGLLLWIPQLALFGSELFTSSTPNLDAAPALSYVLGGFTGVRLILAIWAFVVFLKCLGEVLGVSAWRALASVVAACLVLAIPIAIVFLAFLLRAP